MGKRRTKATKTRPTMLEWIAYHEAGHAVACHILQVPFSYVTIVPDGEESEGHVQLAKHRGRKWLTRQQRENRAMVALAGLAADRILTGRSLVGGRAADTLEAKRQIELWCYSDGEIDLYLRLLKIRIYSELKLPEKWAAVTALAKELLERKRIGSRTARRIIQDAMRPSEKRAMGSA